MKAPKPPKTPDPYKTAAAQAQANISVAVANTVLSNADEVSPEGTLTYEITSYHTIFDPQYNSSGNQTGITERKIPRYTRTTKLTDTGQFLFDQQQQVTREMNRVALTQTGSLNTYLKDPISLDGLPDYAAIPDQTDLLKTLDDPIPTRTTIGEADTTAHHDKISAALYDRLNWQIDREREKKEIVLENQGIFPHSKAYKDAMLQFDRSSNDARVQVELAAGQEQSRVFQIDAMKGQFELEASRQEFTMRVLKLETVNKACLMNYQIMREIWELVANYRERSLQERVVTRGQYLNEISSLLHGGQVSMPRFTEFRAGNIAQTPLAESVYNSAAIDMQKYQIKSQQHQSMMGGILGMVGNLAGPAMMMCSPDYKIVTGDAQSYLH